MIRWHIFADRPIGHTRETGQVAKDSQLDIEAGKWGLFSSMQLLRWYPPNGSRMEGLCVVDKAP